jgi:hypothetical protein
MPFGKARWIDENGRSHNWSGEVASTARNQVKSQIYAQTGAKKVILSSVTPNDGSSYQDKVRDQHEQERKRFAEMEERLKSGGSSSTRNYSKPSYSSSSSSSSGPSMDIESSTGLLILVGAFFAFFTWTPWVLMLIYGAGSTWLAEKVTGQSIADYGDSQEDDQPDSAHKKALAVLLSAVIFGGAGFIHGSNLQKEWEVENNTNQPKAEQVQKQ